MQKMLPTAAVGLVLVACALYIAGCDKRRSIGAGDAGISFSVDTVRFDSVMHSSVSSMRRVSLRNAGKRAVKVARVRLEGNRTDAFRVAVNGEPYEQYSGKSIPAGDSIIIVLLMYTETYVPDAFEQLEAQLVVDFSDHSISLPMRGWNAGWSELDSVIERDVAVPSGGIRYVRRLTEVRPGATLSLGPGAALLFGNGAELRIYGRLEAQGTSGSRVTFLPRRMEPYYMRKPGQWAGVVVEAESRGVNLSHADIRGAVVGLQVKGPTASSDSVKLENCRVLYSSQDGLQLGGGSEAMVIGSIFGQNYRHGVSLKESKAELIYCTICAESAPPQTRLGESLWLDDGVGNAVVHIVNSIIWGDRSVEVAVRGGAALEGRLSADHSVLRIPQDYLRNVNLFADCTVEDPCLELRAQGLYSLGKGSAAYGLGKDLGKYRFDLFGTPRALNTPDAGAVASAPQK